MPTAEIKNLTKMKAHRLAGQLAWFREVSGGSEKLGRLVGYDYDAAQLLMEISFGPLTTASKDSSRFTIVANFSPGYSYYTSVDVFLVDPGTFSNDPSRPHVCPYCGANAFILFRTVECSGFGCKHYRA